MTKTIEKYVFPVCCGTKDGESDGCGVLVGDLFVTAGHVIEHAVVAHVYIDHVDYELRKEDAVYYSFDDKESLDTNASDIAVFMLEGVEPSPLTLAEDLPSIGDDLISVSYLHYAKKNANATSIFDANIEVYEKLVCNAKVTEISENFFASEMEVQLKPGSSGSPVLAGNKVIGILHGGKDSQCVFQSTESLVRLMKKVITDNSEKQESKVAMMSRRIEEICKKHGWECKERKPDPQVFTALF